MLEKEGLKKLAFNVVQIGMIVNTFTIMEGGIGSRRMLNW